MAQLKIPASKFNLISKYSCTTVNEQWYFYGTDELAYVVEPASTYTSDATRASHVVHFDFAELEGATIKSAKMYATLGSPLSGAAISTINGISVGYAKTVSLDIPIDGGTSVDVECVFACNTTWHSHGEGSGASYYQGKRLADGYEIVYESWVYDHISSLAYTDVYLMIEYEPAFTPPVLILYTDPKLYVGETYVKAVHMTELHTNANLVRAAYQLPAYDFPAIVAMESPLANWNADVIEIRAALDTIGVAHEEWLVLDFNRPRLDVLLQLRRVVAALAKGGGEQEETTGEQFYTADGVPLMTADGLYFKALEGTT